jgi:DNA-binding NarL/FixJ family response regulator
MITYPSPIEIGMIKLALQGYSNQQIATALHIQETTVNNRFESIFTKLKVKTRKEAMLWYRRDYNAHVNMG